MPTTQPSHELRALCYEHHVEMRLNVSLLNSKQEIKQTLKYACTAPDCLVHYNITRGYFILSQSGTTHERDMVPNVRCVRDGMPMYLSEIDHEKRAFRLWECPQCGGRQTNEEGLVGSASKEVQEVSTKFEAEPRTPGTALI
ncbi:MAG TPA: hypothetical protein VJO16_13150 [Candidatus Acidoferrum sp.]|nr:hypothetical protein [Candidatus Acidoferrum sp.]